MIELTFNPAQNDWLEVTWTQVEGEQRAELKHTSYHPTQLALLQADAAAMGTPLTDHMTMLNAWVESYVPPPPEPEPVPRAVTMRQARLALLGAGKLALVQPAIDALPEPAKSAAQIEWDYSNEVHRNQPFVLQMSAALGLDSTALDALFVAAAKL